MGLWEGSGFSWRGRGGDRAGIWEGTGDKRLLEYNGVRLNLGLDRVCVGVRIRLDLWCDGIRGLEGSSL